MSKIRLYGATSGYIDLAAPAVADDATLVLPTGADGFASEAYVDTEIASAIAAIPEVAGIGSNVVQTAKTDTFTTTATSFTAITGLTVTITPSSASSKIMVVAMVSNSSSATSVSNTLRLVRGATPIGVADAAGSRLQATGNGSAYLGGSSIIAYLDSPATTSATTYGVEIVPWNATGVAARVNLKHDDSDASDGYRARTISTITAIEVAA
jgi:hypothetical protein